jgi:hypothetical protein
VILSITSAEAAALPEQPAAMADRMRNAGSMRRARRLGRGLRDRWDRR